MNSDSVIASLTAAVEANPDDVPLRLHLAGMLLDAGRSGEAIAHIGQVLARNPQDAEAQRLMGRALGAGGRFCVVGFASGEIPRLPMNIVLLRNRTIIGVDWGDWTREGGRAEGNAALIADFFGRVARGELHPAKPVAVSLEEAVHVLREIGVRSRSAITYVLTP